MNFPRPFLLKGSNPFKPAIGILADRFQQISSDFIVPSEDVEDVDYEEHEDAGDVSLSTIGPPLHPPLHPSARSGRHSRTSSADAESTISGIPLIDFSRTPSPTSYRTRSDTQSEDEDDSIPLSLRPLVAEQRQPSSIWKVRWRDGGLGAFLFGSWAGWQVYVGALTAWHVTASILLVLLNRIILLYGVYKFPYPLAATWIQLFFCHLFLLGWASISRGFTEPLRKIGLSAVVAPSRLPNSSARRSRMVSMASLNPVQIISAISQPFLGIAGGGLVELDWSAAKTVAPLAVVYIGKVLLSNISFAYAPLPLYQLCRIGIVPLTLILTSAILRTNHSIPTLSSALIAWLNLLIASIRTRSHVTWEAVVSGIFSILFTSLYPILIVRTHKLLISSQVQSGEILTTFSNGPGNNNVESGNKQSTRAYYQLLHYTSLISLFLLSPMVIISGELPRIFRNCYFLDVFWFWFICACSGFAAFAVFSTYLALCRATSPVTTTFIGVPKAAAQIVIFSGFRLPVHSWVGVALCWAGTGWYMMVRRGEGRLVEKRRLEGR